jgi:cell division protein FtsI/penicillin-binding protein 2
VTPLQIVTAISAIANNGEVLKPKLLKNSEREIANKLEFSDKSYSVVKSAMREAVLTGTARLLNFSNLKIAAKTGTAERGVKRDRVNS